MVGFGDQTIRAGEMHSGPGWSSAAKYPRNDRSSQENQLNGSPQRNRGPAYKRKHHWMWQLAWIKPASQSHPPDVTGVVRWEERSIPHNYHRKKTFLKTEAQCVTHVSALAALPPEPHMISCIFAFIYTTKCCVCCMFLVGKCSTARFYFLPHGKTLFWSAIPFWIFVRQQHCYFQ